MLHVRPRTASGLSSTRPVQLSFEKRFGSATTVYATVALSFVIPSEAERICGAPEPQTKASTSEFLNNPAYKAGKASILSPPVITGNQTSLIVDEQECRAAVFQLSREILPATHVSELDRLLI
jgi:hypothetical protein